MDHVVFPDQQHIQVQQQKEEEHIKCPRCESSNTKFCYYNNYNLSQPRHYCKNCRRYWTKGGTLRNIPVGGGTRNTKRKRTSSSPPVTMTSSSSVIPSSQPKTEHESSVKYGLESGNQPTAVSGGFSSLLLGFGGNNSNNNNIEQFGNLLMDGGNLLLGSGNGKNDDENPFISGENNNNNYLKMNDEKIGGNERGEWNENGEIGIGMGMGMGWSDLSIFTQPGSSFP